MPMPKRTSVEDFFAQLTPVQRPHLERLRELSHEVDPQAREALKWNLPMYVRGEEGTSLWMLQNFKHHCSLRFPPRFFGPRAAAVKTSGYDTGAGFIKLPYDREIPEALCRRLMGERVAEYEATGAGWGE